MKPKTKLTLLDAMKDHDVYVGFAERIAFRTLEGLWLVSSQKDYHKTNIYRGRSESKAVAALLGRDK